MADTAAGQQGLARRFARYRTPVLPSQGQELRLILGGGSLPRLEMRSGGRSFTFADVAAGPEWRRLVRVPRAARYLLADQVLGEAPVLEVCPPETVVLQPESWPLYAQLAWHWLLLHDRSLCSVHAAVCAYAGEALVLISASGTGKSTLAHALTDLGADYFSDEEACFSTSGYRLYPLQKELCLRPGGVAALGLSGEEGRWYEAKPGDPKQVVPLEPPRGACPQDRVHLIFLEGFGRRPELQPLPGGAVTRLLYRHLGYGSSLVSERLKVAVGLAHRYPTYGLRVGPPSETACLLLEYVGQAK